MVETKGLASLAQLKLEIILTSWEPTHQSKIKSLALSICALGAGQMISPDGFLKDGVVWYSGNSTRRFFALGSLDLAVLLFILEIDVGASFLAVAPDEARRAPGLREAKLGARKSVLQSTYFVRRLYMHPEQMRTAM